jgi:asparagine synthase (glutamine-hydrolysing)
MLDCMAHRGSHRRIWKDGRVVLAATTNRPTARPSHVTRDEAAGTALIADMRLDNRAELADRLGVRCTERSSTSDEALVLRAYRRWQDRTPEFLLGDFAFAIWDGRERCLLLARDHFGVRPLQYFVDEEAVIFGSDARAVAAAGGVLREVNRDRVFDYLVGDTEYVDTTSTFFRGVSRIPAASLIRISPANQLHRRYWVLDAPDPAPSTERPHDVTEFVDVLSEAVRCRSEPLSHGGVMLSGGIDSGSIASVGVSLGVRRAFSGVSMDGIEPESRRIADVVGFLDLDAVRVRPDEVRELCGDYLEEIAQLEDLFDADMTIVRAVCAAAARDGADWLLTGMLADNLAGIGVSEAIAAMITRAHFREAVGTFRGGTIGAASTSMYALKALSLGLVTTALPQPAVGALRQRARRARALAMLRRLHLRAEPTERGALLERSVQTVGPEVRSGNEWEYRHWFLASGMAQSPIERYQRVGARFGVEIGIPFVDCRVVRFFLGLPLSSLVAGGWQKDLVRRAMTGRLPPSVVGNAHRTHLAPEFARRWPSALPEQGLRSLDPAHPIHAYVDVPQLLRSRNAETGMALERVHQAAVWLGGVEADGPLVTAGARC